MTALYSTEPVNIVGTAWRYAIDERTGRGAFQYFDCDCSTWFPFDVYQHKRHGLVTLAELHRALYEPNRRKIEEARKLADIRPTFTLTAPVAAMQFNLI